MLFLCSRVSRRRDMARTVPERSSWKRGFRAHRRSTGSYPAARALCRDIGRYFSLLYGAGLFLRRPIEETTQHFGHVPAARLLRRHGLADQLQLLSLPGTETPLRRRHPRTGPSRSRPGRAVRACFPEKLLGIRHSRKSQGRPLPGHAGVARDGRNEKNGSNGSDWKYNRCWPGSQKGNPG